MSDSLNINRQKLTFKYDPWALFEISSMFPIKLGVIHLKTKDPSNLIAIPSIENQLKFIVQPPWLNSGGVSIPARNFNESGEYASRFIVSELIENWDKNKQHKFIILFSLFADIFLKEIFPTNISTWNSDRETSIYSTFSLNDKIIHTKKQIIRETLVNIDIPFCVQGNYREFKNGILTVQLPLSYAITEFN
jgi:hypothetical protein